VYHLLLNDLKDAILECLTFKGPFSQVCECGALLDFPSLLVREALTETAFNLQLKFSWIIFKGAFPKEINRGY
jgi:hypothetical protein